MVPPDFQKRGGGGSAEPPVQKSSGKTVCYNELFTAQS